jgi:KDO2-lipid IV(A) lauroyltransferase
MQLKYYIFKGLIYTLSIIPFWVYHVVAWLLSRLFYYTGLYRGKVVKANLTKAFPEKSDEEIKTISKRFYLHLADLLIESIKAFSLTEEDIKKRYKFNFSEEVQRLCDEKRNIAIVLHHYNNWEWATMGLNFIAPRNNPKMLIMYKTLKDPVAEKIVKQSRGRFAGTYMFPKDNVIKEVIAHKDEHYALGFAADQAPANSYNSYWMQFLGIETGVFFGVEKFSQKNDLAVVYCHVRKKKRSYYEIDMELIAEHPSETSVGFITKKHMHLLEADIQENPQYWLWTHKRWKRSKPLDYDEKRNAQKR